MAQARKKKPQPIWLRLPQPKSPWLRRFLQFVIIPLFIWLLAFLIWFNWASIEKLFGRANLEDGPARKAKSKTEKLEKPEKAGKAETAAPTEEPSKPERAEPPRPPVQQRPSEPKEKILDEDRKRLEDILKKQ